MDIDELAVRLEALEGVVRHRFGPVTDPAPDDFGRWRWPLGDYWREWRVPVPIPNPGDPSPIDFGRLSKIQLQMVKFQIAAERVRLDSMEQLLEEQIKTLDRG